MSSSLNSIKLNIIGKPNSGKSTLFNSLLGEDISPVGDEYGLTKKIYRDSFKYKSHEFIIVDTPGMRRRRKIIDKNEIKRNTEVVRLVKDVDIIILLIDSQESITRQDFKLADIAIRKNKILFFVFNKIDIIEDKRSFKKKINKYLELNYSKFKYINIEYISAKKNIKITNLLSNIINKKKALTTLIQKQKLNNFIDLLQKKGVYPKINKIEIKPKYIVQLENEIPKFKIFLNTKKKAPQIFQKFFDNSFRNYFQLEGIPIIYNFISSKNPFSS